VEGLFEFASKTGHLGCYSRSRGTPAGFEFNVIRADAPIKSRTQLFNRLSRQKVVSG
jgi:hypothetical protein